MNRLMSGMPGAAPTAGDAAQVDTAEQVYISSLALLKMLKHGARFDLSRLTGRLRSRLDSRSRDFARVRAC